MFVRATVFKFVQWQKNRNYCGLIVEMFG